MKKKNLIYVKDFCEKHNITRNSFDSMKSTGYFPKDIFDYSEGRGYHKIDDGYFLEKKEKVQKMWGKACNNYYILMDHFTEYSLSKELNRMSDEKSINSWRMFFHENLFTPPNERITNLKPTRGVYLFLRYSNWIIRRLARGENVCT